MDNIFDIHERIHRAAQSGRLDINQAIDLIRWTAEGGHLQEPHKLCVNYYTSRLNDSELDHLLAHADRIQRQSVPLAHWLRGVVNAEWARRETLETNRPHEPFQPDATAWMAWSLADLADANQALLPPTRVVESFELGKFLDACTVMVSAVLRSKARSLPGGTKNDRS